MSSEPSNPSKLDTKGLLAQISNHWNRRAATYQSNMNADFMNPKVYRRWTEVIFSILGNDDKLTILDAGCGTGALSHILANHGEHRILAVDISEQMLRNARNNLSSWSDRIEFLNQDITQLPIQDASFDLIVSRFVVWTLPHPEQAIKEWYRLLKPNGKIILIDGNWYRSFFSSPIARTWMKCVQLIYRIRNRKLSGQKLADHYVAKLYLTHLLRPDWDIGLLIGLGFTRINVLRHLDRIIYPNPIQRLRDPFSAPFLIYALKP